MILREGVNSLLMKFAEDIKLEGVVNTNEDSKAVRRDLEGRTLAGDLDHGAAGVMVRVTIGWHEDRNLHFYQNY